MNRLMVGNGVGSGDGIIRSGTTPLVALDDDGCSTSDGIIKLMYSRGVVTEPVNGGTRGAGMVGDTLEVTCGIGHRSRPADDDAISLVSSCSAPIIYWLQRQWVDALTRVCDYCLVGVSGSPEMD